MFIDNEKISCRQMFRLYTFDLLGMATIFVPPILAGLTGMDGVFSILLGSIAGLIYLAYLGWAKQTMQMGLCAYLKEKTSKLLRNFVCIFCLFHCVITASFCGKVFARLMQYSLIKEASFWVVLGVILLASAYAVSGGIEVRARVYEVLFYVVLIPYVFMLLLSLKDFEIAYLKGMLQTDYMDVLRGSYLVFLFFTPLFFLLYFGKEKGENYVKSVRKAIVLSGALLLLSFLLLMGNFGANALAEMDYPVITLMSTIQFQGNFVKRMDAFMVAVWLVMLFALLNLHLHYAVQTLKNGFGNTSRKDISRRSVWAMVPIVFVGASFLEFSSQGVELFLEYYIYLAVPLFWLIPFLVVVRRR